MTIIEQLDLSPHPEGGHFRETIRLADGPDGRSRMTAILFLLEEGERSHWHRVDADEVWLWHSGTSLTLRIEGNEPVTLGADLSQGQELPAIVPAGAWQSAEVSSGWALVTCIVTPGFNFSGFELAPPDWSPG